MSASRLLSALALLLATTARGSALPERLFNDGKPFYVARDPITGAIDFDSRNDLQSSYPLISSSYANTKVQGHGNVRRNPAPSRAPTAPPVYYYSSASVVNTVSEKNLATRTPVNTVTTTVSPPTTTTAATTTSTTTRRPYISFFDDLFGDYDNLQSNSEVHEASPPAVPTTVIPQEDTYDEYEYGPLQALEPERYHPTTIRTQEFISSSTAATTTTTTTTTPSSSATTASMSETIPTMPTITAKVTSMPLGDNHPTHGVRWKSTSSPITRPTPRSTVRPTAEIVSRERPAALLRPAPSTSSVHIAPDQDVVSFVVGNHQHVDESSYVGSQQTQEDFHSDSFRPLYYRRPLPTSTTPTTLPPSPQTAIPTQKVSIGTTREPSYTIREKPHTIRFPDEKNEILSLYSRPMMHQLPDELTPPVVERHEPVVPVKRPPWDPRPGHFNQGRPEYAQPPRAPVRPPPRPDLYKRIDGLPNILPQFRPNARGGPRPVPAPASFFGRPAGPPRIPVANRRSGDDHAEVATLQMIQAKQASANAPPLPTSPPHRAPATERPLYVVYPVNSSPIKMDALDGTGERESVVIGTRGEQLPLPPSRIAQEPVLRPQARPSPVASKPAEFPYMLERPSSTTIPAPVIAGTISERSGSEFTVSAVMHTHPVHDKPVMHSHPVHDKTVMHSHSVQNKPVKHVNPIHDNHRRTGNITPQQMPPPQDFQAPFQASVSIDAQGWSAAAPAAAATQPTTLSPTPAPFSVDNFAPQLFGGFRPIYGAETEEMAATDPSQ